MKNIAEDTKNLQNFRSFGEKLLRLFFGKSHRINFFLFAIKESKKKETKNYERCHINFTLKQCKKDLTLIPQKTHYSTEAFTSDSYPLEAHARWADEELYKF